MNSLIWRKRGPSKLLSNSSEFSPLWRFDASVSRTILVIPRCATLLRLYRAAGLQPSACVEFKICSRWPHPPSRKTPLLSLATKPQPPVLVLARKDASTFIMKKGFPFHFSLSLFQLPSFFSFSNFVT